MPRNPRQEIDRQTVLKSALDKLASAQNHVTALTQLRQQITEVRSTMANGVPGGSFDQSDVDWIDSEIASYATQTLQQTLQLAPLLSAEIVITVDGQQVQPA